MKKKMFLLAIIILSFNALLNAQLMENSSFKIYRAECGLEGTITFLRLNADHSFQIRTGSDHKNLVTEDNSEGSWTQVKDTIFLNKDHKAFIKKNTIILYHADSEHNSSETFHLIYDTYPDGIAKMIHDRYLENEYKIDLLPNGGIQSVKHYKNGKLRN